MAPCYTFVALFLRYFERAVFARNDDRAVLNARPSCDFGRRTSRRELLDRWTPFQLTLQRVGKSSLTFTGTFLDVSCACFRLACGGDSMELCVPVGSVEFVEGRVLLASC